MTLKISKFFLYWQNVAAKVPFLNRYPFAATQNKAKR
jgi:hypothetical protein